MGFKTVWPFGTSPTDLLVKKWVERHGIDANLVHGYRITRGHNDVPLIELVMLYGEEEVAGDGVQD